MKSFLDHLKEEVLPTVQVADGGLDISKPAVRAAINAAIAGVVSQPAVTPYVVFNRLSKLLAQYHIILPKRFLEGDKGVEVFEVKQFGHKMGMTDSGEFVNEVPSTHYLFLQYGILSPFGITYAKPVVGGMFKVMARLVDKAELDKLMDMAEITMAEEAEQMQAIAKANAPKEGMHTALGDCDCSQGDSPSTKKAIKVSMKKIDEEQIDEVSLAKAAKTARLRNLGAERSAHASPYDYSPHIDVQRRKAGKTVDRIGLKHGDDKAKKVSDKMSKDTDKVWRGKMEEDKDPCWKGYEMIGMKKKGGRKVPNCVPVEEATDKDRDLSKLADTAMDKGHPVKKLPAGRAQNAVLPKGMARGTNIEKGRWSGHGKFDEEFGVYRKGGSIGEKPSTDPIKSFDNEADAKSHAKGMNRQLSPGEKKYYRIKYHVKPIREEEQLDELTGKGKLPALKAVYKGDKDYHSRSADYHAARADRAERRGEDSKAERHMDAGYGHEHKAERAEAKSKRASALMTRAKAHADIKASKAASKSARAEYNEETQIDEVSKRAAISAYREKEAQERDTGKLHGLIKRKFGAATAKHAERAGAADTGNLVHRGKSHGVDRLASAKSSSEMRKSKDGKIHKQDVASKKSEIKFRKSMSKFDKPRGHLPEETQIDELKKSTLASYIKKAHVSGLEAASQGEIAYANKDKAGLRAANKTGEKREQGIERAAGKLAKEETIAEKAPPGAKYERMVRHIKKSYGDDKDGLTKKEKSIAYATAWKAKNLAKGE